MTQKSRTPHGGNVEGSQSTDTGSGPMSSHHHTSSPRALSNAFQMVRASELEIGALISRTRRLPMRRIYHHNRLVDVLLTEAGV